MILSKEVEIKITKKNLIFYKNLKYEVKLKDVIKISPENLTRGSHIKIEVKCDICGKEKEMDYREYMDSYEIYNVYACNSIN